MPTIHVFKFRRRNADFWESVEGNEFLANRLIRTAFLPSVFVKPEVWPAVRDHLEFVGIQLYNEHVKLANLKRYHFIADSECFEVLEQIAAAQRKKHGVRVIRYQSAVIEFPPVLGFDA